MAFKKSFAVLITCHNRKDTTIRSLECLFSQEGIDVDFNFEVFLVDDGSIDGTSKEIRMKFPKVKIINGSGALYWNRGMLLAWDTSLSKGCFDGYLWLNDDTELFSNTLKLLYQYVGESEILVGSTKSKITQNPTYGGYNSNNKLIKPTTVLQNCEYFNGNFVFVPHLICTKIGLLDKKFHHALGDFEYGLRARKAGYNIFVLPGFIGFCEGHDRLPAWRDPQVKLSIRIRSLYSPLSGCHPLEYFYFDKKHKGIVLAVIHLFTIHLRAISPKIYNLAIRYERK